MRRVEETVASVGGKANYFWCLLIIVVGCVEVREAESPMVISLLRMHSTVVDILRCGCYLRITAVFRVLQSGVPRSKPAAVRCR